MAKIGIVFSETGDSLAVFYKENEIMEYQIIKEISELDTKKGLTDNHITLINQLLASKTPGSHLEVLKNIRNTMQDLEKELKNLLKQQRSTLYDNTEDIAENVKCFNNSFEFFHQNTAVHPGHNRSLRLTKGLESYCFHEESLDSIITFFEEYHFNIFKDTSARQITHGYQYERTTWSGKFGQWWTIKDDEDFRTGREMAKAKL